MKHLARIALVTLAFLAGHSSSPAQMPSDSSAFQRARVEFLVGTFATATNFPSTPSMPKGATGKGTSVITWALDSMFLSIDDQSVNSLFGHFNQHGMLGFDSQTHQFVLSMFNNFGDRPTYHGNFVGDTLVLQTKVLNPRRPFDQKLQWYKDGTAVQLRVLNDFGKGFLLTLEQTATPASQKTK